MCGRYGFIPPKDFFDRLQITNRHFELEANYNVAPGEIMPVVVANSPKRVEHMKWGLIPYWAKEKEIGFRTINARVESIEDKPSFKKLIINKRCLIPASYFYEWQTENEKTKIPYLIKLKNRQWFTFAGLYDIWKDTNGLEVKSYTIITTQSDNTLQVIHPRMPVILNKEQEEIWSDNSKYNPEVLSLLKLNENNFEFYRVSIAVNNPKNNSIDLINPE